jgi:hypothetical protein
VRRKVERRLLGTVLATAVAACLTVTAPAWGALRTERFDQPAGTALTTQVPGVEFPDAPVVFTPKNTTTSSLPRALRSSQPCPPPGGCHRLRVNFTETVGMVQVRVGVDSAQAGEFPIEAKLEVFGAGGKLLDSSPVRVVADSYQYGPITTTFTIDRRPSFDIASARVTVGQADSGAGLSPSSPVRADIDDLQWVDRGAGHGKDPPGEGAKTPEAAASLITPDPAPGRLLLFDASASRPSHGARIVAHEWDWDNDGTFDANTGIRPVGSFMFGRAGQREIRLRVTDDSGQRAVTLIPITINPPPPGCSTELQRENVEIVAYCIVGGIGHYTITSWAGQVRVNGLVLQSSNSNAQMTWDLRDGVLESDSTFKVMLPNMPAGDVVLHETERTRTDSGREVGLLWALPRGPRDPLLDAVHPDGYRQGPSIDPPPRLRTATHGRDSGSPGFHLATFRADVDNCSAGETCLDLPGGFPIAGHVDIYINDDREAVVDVQVVLRRIVEVAGDVRLRLSTDSGLHLDTLKFEAADTDLGIFRLQELRFQYNAPGTGDPVSDDERWEASLKVELPSTPRVKLGGAIRFTNGELTYLRVSLTTPGIPIAPGVRLNQFEGGYGNPPLRIEAGFGAQLVEVGDLTGRVIYTEENGIGRARATGELTVLEQRVAEAYVDIWSNGFVAFGGGFDLRFPQRSPKIRVTGRLDAWFEDVDGIRFQVEGNARLEAWIINVGAKVLVNSNWIAGCAIIETFLGDAKAKAAYNHRNGDFDFGFNCRLGRYRIEPLHHEPPEVGSAQAEPASFSVPAGLDELALRVSSGSGTPVVVLTSPSGERFTSATAAGEVAGARGRFMSAQAPGENQTIVHLLDPQAGEWRLEPAPGAPADLRLETAKPLPSPGLSAAVSADGPARELRYRFRPVRGMKVSFVERGGSVTRLLRTTSKRTGVIRFTPQEGPAGSRRIEAIIDQPGAPPETRTVARFRAPRLRGPGRPGPVKLRRRGHRVIASWGASSGATGYRVFVAGSDGRRRFHFLPARPRKLVIRIEPFESVTVTVRGEAGSARRAGPSSSKRLKARRLPRRE